MGGGASALAGAKVADLTEDDMQKVASDLSEKDRQRVLLAIQAEEEGASTAASEAPSKAEEKPCEAPSRAEEKQGEAPSRAEEKLCETPSKAEEKLCEAPSKAQEKLCEAPSKAQEKLWVSASLGKCEDVKEALNEGADVNAPRMGGKIENLLGGGATATMLAARAGMHDCVKLLKKEQKADLEITDADGWTVVHFAALHGRKAVLEVLAELGVNFEAVTKFKKNALDLLEEDLGSNPPKSENDARLTAKNFLKDVKGMKTSPQGDLFKCGRKGDVEGMRDALNRGADVNLSNVDSYTVLMCVAEEGHAECIKVLKESGADLGATDRDGWTAVHFAACRGKIDCLKMLKKHGVDMGALTKFERNAVDLLEEKIMDATEEESENLKAGLSWLKSIEMRTTPQWNMFKGARSGDSGSISVALKQGADINLKNVSGCSALMVAADFGSDECVKMLHESGSDLETSDRDGWTAVHFAACAGQPSTLKLLHDLGANLGALTNFRRNALDLAEERKAERDEEDAEAIKGYKEVITFLKLKKMTFSAQALLWKHAKSGDLSGLRKALEQGAEVNLRDLDGQTAAKYAAEQGHQECLKLLKDHGAVFEG